MRRSCCRAALASKYDARACAGARLQALAPAAIASYVPVLDAAAAAYAAALAASPAPANVGAQGAAAVVGGLAVSIFGRAFTTEELAALTDATVKMIGGANAVNIDTPFTNYGVALAGTRALRTLVQGALLRKRRCKHCRGPRALRVRPAQNHTLPRALSPPPRSPQASSPPRSPPCRRALSSSYPAWWAMS